MVKNEKFQCPSERGGPEDFSNYPTFVPSAIFGGVMASQNMVNFFLGHPVEEKMQRYLSNFLDNILLGRKYANMKQ